MDYICRPSPAAKLATSTPVQSCHPRPDSSTRHLVTCPAPPWTSRQNLRSLLLRHLNCFSFCKQHVTTRIQCTARDITPTSILAISQIPAHLRPVRSLELDECVEETLDIWILTCDAHRLCALEQISPFTGSFHLQ